MNILLYDLEITPILGWAYDMWDANILKVEREPLIMCFSYQWLGEKKVHHVAQPDYPTEYEKNPQSDFYVVARLWTLLNEADIVIAHNARKFDNRVASARFITHKFPPPSPYKTVDTLQAARRYFRFGSNSLANLCERLEIGSKPKTTHAQLWHDCINGDPVAWKKMKKYCNQDVRLLAGLYDKLLPYISNHPRVTDGAGCPKCGSKHSQYRGYARTAVGTFRRLQCVDCGGWHRERASQKEKPEFVNAN